MENYLSQIERFIRQSIAEEQQTIAEYIERKEIFKAYLEQLPDLELKDKLNILIYTLNDITDEEKVHVGQFREMLSLFNVSNEKEIEGNNEAKKDIEKLSFVDVAKQLATYVDGGIE